MVIDDLIHLRDYAGLHPAVEVVADFIDRHQLSSLPDGRLELEGTGGYANVQTLSGKTEAEAVLETHRKMIDIQVPLSMDEAIGYAPIGSLPSAEYDEARDIAFHDGRPDEFLKVRMGTFAIFFPQDAHAPGVFKGEGRKIVFKLPVLDEINQNIIHQP